MTNDSHKRRAVIYTAWGEKYIKQVWASINRSKLPLYPIFVITDHATQVHDCPENVNIIRADFKLHGLIRKSELPNFLPSDIDSFLYLDVDTIVLDDISLGFEKAEDYGLALAAAPHYSLDYFDNFSSVLNKDGFDYKGQLQYNTGVIFFTLGSDVVEVFRVWGELAMKYADINSNDQPYFSLAVEKCGFNPYTLSPSYNYRNGKIISGVVRVYHSYHKMPADINKHPEIFSRKADKGLMLYPLRRKVARFTFKFAWFFSRLFGVK